MSSTQIQQSKAQVKGTCDARWGPGCQSKNSPDENHFCQLARGHTQLQCECYYCGLKQINQSRARV
jgi:hypothetical protein